MKTLILLTALTLAATTSQAATTIKKFATCKNQNQTITIFSAGNDKARMTIQEGDEEEDVYKNVKESMITGQRTFDAGSFAVVIDTDRGTSAIYTNRETIPLTCTMASEAEMSPQYPHVHRGDCVVVPAWYNIDRPEDEKICPLSKLWARGAIGGYQCCEHPPV